MSTVLGDLTKLFGSLVGSSRSQAGYAQSFARSFETIKQSVKALDASLGPNSFMRATKDLAAPTFVGAALKHVKDEAEELQKSLDVFSTSIITRSKLLSATLEAAFKGGGPTATAAKSIEALGRLDFSQTIDGLVDGAKYATKMSEALGVSADQASLLVFYAKQSGTPLKQMGDVMSTIKENTRLTADEFGRFSQDIGKAVASMGAIKDISMVLKDSLRIDDALRTFTGSSGDYVQFFQNMARSSQGLQNAMAFGLNVDDLGRDGAQQQFIRNLGLFVDKLIVGQPLMQQTAILEQLSEQTGLSTLALRNLSKAAQELQNKTERQVTLDQRYAEQMANLGKATDSIGHSLHQLGFAVLMPLVTITTKAAEVVASALTKMRELPGVFTALTILGIVPTVIAFRGLMTVVQVLVRTIPSAIAGLMAFNRSIQQVGLSSALASTARGITGGPGGLMGRGSFQNSLPVPSAGTSLAVTAAAQASGSVFQRLFTPLFGQMTASTAASNAAIGTITNTIRGGIPVNGAGFIQSLRSLFTGGLSLVGSSFVSVFVSSIKTAMVSVLGPISKALAWLASPVGLAGLAVAAAAATAVWLIKKDIDLIRETRQIEADNRQNGLRMMQTLRNDLIDKSSKARFADVSLTGKSDRDTLASINIRQAKMIDGKLVEQQYNFGMLMEAYEKQLEVMRKGTADEGAITEVQAAQAKKEFDERYAMILRNAVASAQSMVMTENRPVNNAELRQLELLEKMVKYLEVQVKQKDIEIQEAKKREEAEQARKVQEAITIRNRQYRGGP